MNTLLLREFLTIAQTLSFDKASEMLFTSQPNLSKHMKRLEESLGVVLFERTSRRVELSQAGLLLLPSVKEIIAAEDRMNQRLAEFKKNHHTVLNLGSIANIAAYNLGSLFQKFQEEYPACYLNICGGAPQEMYQRLLSGERELVFLRYDKQTDMSRFSIIPFMVDRLVAVCPKNHPITRNKSVSLNELAHENIISFAEGSFMYQFIQNAFLQAGVTPHIVMSAHRTDNLLYLTGYQMGICLLMRYPARTINDDRMVLVDIQPPIENRVDLCYCKDKPLSQAAKSFIACFQRWQNSPDAPRED